MGYLLIVSIIWAFSFGLTKKYLMGLDSSFVALVRMTLSLAVFVPFLRVRNMTLSRVVIVMTLGAIQYGFMYVLYIASFRTLAAHQVALFASTTPFYVVVLEDVLERRFRIRFVGVATLAVCGTVVASAYGMGDGAAWFGFCLVQGSNLCFAIGQVWFRRLGPGPGPARSEFGFSLAGAVTVTALAVLLTPASVPETLSMSQIMTLAYLGILASGLGFFFWNIGATRTNAAVLAASNNAKVPLAVAVSLAVFGESTNLSRLVVGGTMVVVALWLGSRE